jgi:phosphoribosyl-ATP pyrophosphohydrolase
MKINRDITEAKIIRQAKSIFNNTFDDVLAKFKEESNELIVACESEPIFTFEQLDELGDVCYVLCQLLDMSHTNYNESLQRAFDKNERKRV